MIGAMVLHCVGINLARCKSFSSSSRDHSVFLILGSSHSNQRALHCLADLRWSNEAIRDHWFFPYFITAALRISSYTRIKAIENKRKPRLEAHFEVFFRLNFQDLSLIITSVFRHTPPLIMILGILGGFSRQLAVEKSGKSPRKRRNLSWITSKKPSVTSPQPSFHSTLLLSANYWAERRATDRRYATALFRDVTFSRTCFTHIRERTPSGIN